MTFEKLKFEMYQGYEKSKTTTDQRFYLFGIIALETGARISDVLKLEYEQIDGEYITYLNQKSNKTQTQKLSEKTRRIIEAFKQSNQGLGIFSPNIFFNPVKDALLHRGSVHRRIVKEFDIKPHDLRHLAGQRVCSQAGIPLAQKFLGHSRASTTDKYLNVSEDEYLNQMNNIKM